MCPTQTGENDKKNLQSKVEPSSVGQQLPIRPLQAAWAEHSLAVESVDEPSQHSKLTPSAVGQHNPVRPMALHASLATQAASDSTSVESQHERSTPVSDGQQFPINPEHPAFAEQLE